MSLWMTMRPTGRIINRVFDDFFRDFEAMDRAFAPYWRTSNQSSLNIANTTQEVVNDDTKFAVSLDVSHFKPEELRVNLEGRELVIEGNRNKRLMADTRRGWSFLRKWTLPTDADLDAITPSISDKGHLTIEVLKKANENTRRTIPIQPEVTAP
uniref:SHSP domain-containing protein n=1 Tax=Heterorhabditis bacteriophora TaxID=37862 RepID=A0A1I7XQD7_HETBA